MCGQGAPVLDLHPSLADSLVRNLLQNAVKHSLPGSEILLKLSPDALTISNPGPAITGDSARYFERFCKHQATSSSPGLGLAIVRQICQLYGFALYYDFTPIESVHTLRVDFRSAAARGLRSEK